MFKMQPHSLEIRARKSMLVLLYTVISWRFFRLEASVG
jgi:hypothetical protein